jgi:hypothetical protein
MPSRRLVNKGRPLAIPCADADLDRRDHTGRAWPDRGLAACWLLAEWPPAKDEPTD